MLLMGRLGRSISAKLVVLQVMLMGTVVLVAGLACYYTLETVIRADARDKMNASAHVVASMVQHEFEDLTEVFERIVSSDAVAHYYKSYNSYALEEYFRNYAELFPGISYANALGEEEVKLIRSVRSETYLDLADTYNFQQAELKPNTLIVSRPSRGSEILEPALTLSYRYLDFFDVFFGYVKTELPLSHFDDLLNEFSISDRGFSVITDDRGLIVHAPDPSWRGMSLSVTDTDAFFLNDTRQHEHFFGEYTVLGVPGLAAVTHVPDLNWKVSVVMPMEDYYAHNQRFRTNMMIVGGGLALLGGFVTLWFSRTLARPLVQLTGVIHRIVDQDKFNERVIWDSKDELGQLADAFNTMLTHLERSREDMVSSRQQFEDIIASMADALLVTDMDGVVTRVNLATEQLLGFDKDIIVGRSIFDFVTENREQLRAMITSNYLDDGSVCNVEVVLTHSEFRRLPTTISSGVLHDANGERTGMVFVAKDITERKRNEEHLSYLANHDSLTDLPNRMLLLDRLAQAMSRITWHHRLLAVMFLDLDRFKWVNDTLGHHEGDDLLKQVAQRLCAHVREGDTVARLGGDEFVIVLNDVAKKEDVSRLAEKILHSINQPFVLANEQFVTTTSIGISLYPSDGDNPGELLKNADAAMYGAKGAGRNTYQYYSPRLNENAAERMQLENAMRRALDNGEFVCYYQPQVSLKSGAIIGVEALVRWDHPEHRIIPPAKFLPLAEETGLIVPMGEQVLQMAAKQAAKWRDSGLRPIRVSVNIAEQQFKLGYLENQVADVLNQYGLDPCWLGLELTERILMDRVTDAGRIVEALKALGVRLSLDDFGTGYSSLASLKTFDLDEIKIDGAFVKGIPDDVEAGAITRAVVEMGRSLGLTVIAEGVEHKAQLAFLEKLGCDHIQGFYFSKPEHVDLVTAMLVHDKRLVEWGDNISDH